MLLSRILGGIGRFCISLGVLTLLFVAYQLWGTGILTAQAQNGLEDDFESRLAEAQDLALVEAEPVADTSADPNEPAVEATDPEADAEAAAEAAAAEEEARRLSEAERELLANFLWQPNGEPIGKISAPTIGLDWIMVAGVGTEELRNGPGHYPSTPLPGMPGNASIAGHRTTWGAPFNRIDELKPGDIITTQTIQGVFEYRVLEQESGKGHFIVTPDRVDVLDQDFAAAPNRLTLTACHPKFSARQRIIVVAELIGEPAEYIPRPGALGDAEGPSLASEDFAGTDTEAVDPGDTTEDGTALPGDADLIAAEDAATPEPTATPDPDDESDPSDPDAVEGAAAAGTDDTDGTGGATGQQAQPAGLQNTEAAVDDFGEGLNGDSSAVVPAVMWGLAAAAIAGAAGFAARRWRKVTSYAISLVPFALVLFVCFVNIDKALPSY